MLIAITSHRVVVCNHFPFQAELIRAQSSSADRRGGQSASIRAREKPPHHVWWWWLWKFASRMAIFQVHWLGVLYNSSCDLDFDASSWTNVVHSWTPQCCTRQGAKFSQVRDCLDFRLKCLYRARPVFTGVSVLRKSCIEYPRFGNSSLRGD